MSNYQLPRKFTEAWLEALRSGEYTQVTGTLTEFIRPNDKEEKWGYCCLGLAGAICDVSNGAMCSSGMVVADASDDSDAQTLYEDALAKGYPVELMDMFYGEQKQLPHELAKMNDDGKSFTEIADWVETNVMLYDLPDMTEDNLIKASKIL